MPGRRSEKYGSTAAPASFASREVAVLVAAGTPKNGTISAPLPRNAWSGEYQTVPPPLSTLIIERMSSREIMPAETEPRREMKNCVSSASFDGL